jgi:hypothetical protein
MGIQHFHFSHPWSGFSSSCDCDCNQLQFVQKVRLFMQRGREGERERGKEGERERERGRVILTSPCKCSSYSTVAEACQAGLVFFLNFRYEPNKL